MRRDLCHFFPADVKTVYNGYLAALGNKQFRRECREEPYYALTFGLNFSMKYNFNGGSCTVRFMPYQNGTAVNLRFSLAQLAGARYGAYDNDLTLAVEKELGIVAQTADIDVDDFLKPQNQVAQAQQVYQAPPPVYEAPKQPVYEQPIYEAPTQPVYEQPIYEEPAQPVYEKPIYEQPIYSEPTQSIYEVPQQPVYEQPIYEEPAPAPAPAPAPTPAPAQFGYCSACGTPLREGAAFCVSCGTPVAAPEKHCSACGALVEEGDAFCSSCGNKL